MTDPVFRAMEADLYNIAPSIGEVNGDRSNFNYGQLPSSVLFSYGQCQSRVDFKNRIFEPRNEVKGQVARVMFYTYDRYNLNMSKQQQQLLIAWGIDNFRLIIGKNCKMSELVKLPGTKPVCDW